MFTSEERACLRSDLLEYAASDSRISGAAITGSAAAEREDRWSDIDLAFGVADADELPRVLSEWTEHMYTLHDALHHLDINSGLWVYRVFLLPSTLQVDLGFAPAHDFRALAPSFRLMFGEANEPRPVPPPTHGGIIGLGWLYALHARSCIARRKFWQAEYMISGVRDNALALACVRYGLSAVHGRDMDQLPGKVTAPFESSLVQELNSAELSRAFREVVDGLLGEIRSIDRHLAERLQANADRTEGDRGVKVLLRRVSTNGELFPRHMGLPFRIWISVRGGSRHDVRVKVSSGPEAQSGNKVRVSLRPDVHVLKSQRTGTHWDFSRNGSN